MTRGINALKRYLKKHHLSINRFARENKLDSPELAKLLRGERHRVSVGTAAKIQDGTNGEVQWRLWV